MASKANEQTFQADIINQMISSGWLLGTPEGYNRELALYEEDSVSCRTPRTNSGRNIACEISGNITLIIENKNSRGYIFALGTLSS